MENKIDKRLKFQKGDKAKVIKCPVLGHKLNNRVIVVKYSTVFKMYAVKNHKGRIGHYYTDELIKWTW